MLLARAILVDAESSCPSAVAKNCQLRSLIAKPAQPLLASEAQSLRSFVMRRASGCWAPSRAYWVGIGTSRFGLRHAAVYVLVLAL